MRQFIIPLDGFCKCTSGHIQSLNKDFSGLIDFYFLSTNEPLQGTPVKRKLLQGIMKLIERRPKVCSAANKAKGGSFENQKYMTCLDLFTNFFFAS